MSREKVVNEGGQQAFRFKQFVIRQDRAAMKVGFDGVLLGAWSQVAGARRVLDVGTGTGILSLMIAQRLEAVGERAVVDAVEVDANAAANARENLRKSPWSDWFTLHVQSLQTFQAVARYDLIVCNPPFFRQGPRSPVFSRARARHADGLPWLDLCQWVASHLTPTGRLAVILPSAETMATHEQAERLGLVGRRQRGVRSLPGRDPHRTLVEYSLEQGRCVVEDTLTIENASPRVLTRLRCANRRLLLARYVASVAAVLNVCDGFRNPLRIGARRRSCHNPSRDQ